MSQERTYVVIPASVIAEHGRRVTSGERWKAWREAREREPELKREPLAVVPESQLQGLGGEIWTKGEV